MSAGMAGVIAAHVLWEYGEPETSWSPGESVAQCSCGVEHGGWVHTAGGEECPDWDKEHAAHIAEELAKAGYGNLQEAKAKALREAAKDLASIAYVVPGGAGRAEYESRLAVRRGDTDKWLHARADLIDALADPEGRALVQAIHDRKAEG